MLFTIHLLVGAALGKFLGPFGWPATFLVAFISHFLLDMLPHADPATLKRPAERGTMNRTDFLLAWADIVVGFFVFSLLVANRQFSISVLAGMAGSVLPDFATPAFTIFPALTRLPIASHYYRFHKNIQRVVDKKDWPKGAAVELVVGAISVLLFVL